MNDTEKEKSNIIEIDRREFSDIYHTIIKAINCIDLYRSSFPPSPCRVGQTKKDLSEALSIMRHVDRANFPAYYSAGISDETRKVLENILENRSDACFKASEVWG